MTDRHSPDMGTHDVRTHFRDGSLVSQHSRTNAGVAGSLDSDDDGATAQQARSAALAAVEAEHAGFDDDWADEFADKLTVAANRARAAAAGARAAADECRAIQRQHDSGGSFEFNRLSTLADRANRLAREAEEESSTVDDPGCASDITNCSAMAQSYAAEVRGCRDAMKALVLANEEGSTLDEMVQESRSAADEAQQLAEECRTMRDSAADDDDFKNRLKELARDAKRTARETNYAALNVKNPEALQRSECELALEGVAAVRGIRDRAAALVVQSA